MKLLTMEERVRAAKVKIWICVAILAFLVVRHWLTGAPVLR